MESNIITPKTHPNHEVVGQVFRGYDDQLYFCDSFDPRVDYYMTNILDRSIRKDVSVNAIGRTFHSQWVCNKPHAERLPSGQVCYYDSGCTAPRTCLGFYVVDTSVPAVDMKAVYLEAKDCLELPETHFLFELKGYAERFLKNVAVAFAGLAEAQASWARRNAWTQASVTK